MYVRNWGVVGASSSSSPRLVSRPNVHHGIASGTRCTPSQPPGRARPHLDGHRGGGLRLTRAVQWETCRTLRHVFGAQKPSRLGESGGKDDAMREMRRACGCAWFPPVSALAAMPYGVEWRSAVGWRARERAERVQIRKQLWPRIPSLTSIPDPNPNPNPRVRPLESTSATDTRDKRRRQTDRGPIPCHPWPGLAAVDPLRYPLHGHTNRRQCGDTQQLTRF